MDIEVKNMKYDVAVVAGSSTGLAAALTLGKITGTTILFTQHSTPQTELLAIGRDYVNKFRLITIANKKIIGAEKEGKYFNLFAADDSRYFAKHIILATGLTDTMPTTNNVKELLADKFVHCPFCYECEKQRLSGLVNEGNQLAVTLGCTLTQEGSVLVNDKFETNVPGVFAVKSTRDKL